MPSLNINGKDHEVDADSSVPLLWALRDSAGLMGTKYGCGIGSCGACTVHLGGKPVHACRVTVGEAAGHEVVTIEGIADSHPIVRAFAAQDVPACGYCIPGQIMRAVALLKEKPNPEDEDITDAMQGNICRCGAYPRIMAAIRQAAGVDR